MNANWKQKASSTTSILAKKARKEVKVKKPLRENIIFVGSEMSYDSFWLKMMFVAAAYRIGKFGQVFRVADRQTLAYVDVGYSRFEKLALDFLSDRHGWVVKKISGQSDVVAIFNDARSDFKLQDVAFFSHGLVGKIALNYSGGVPIDLDASLVGNIRRDAFLRGGRIFSYACRTGVSVDDYKQGFDNDEEAKPEHSLAQKMADHFNVEVNAYLRRTFYGSVLREKSQSNGIVAALKEAREGGLNGDGVIDLSPDHQALPHPGLANSGFTGVFGIGAIGGIGEGTNNYSLWRKAGGAVLPTAADSPEGLSREMRTFRPAKASQ